LIQSPAERHELSFQIDERRLNEFCGRNDQRIAEIEQHMGVRIVIRGSMIKIIGEQDAVEKTELLLKQLLDVFQEGAALPPQQMRFALRHAEDETPGEKTISEIFKDAVNVPRRGKRISAMTAGQKRYLEAIRKNDVVFGVGPAGTGKTYLAVAMAVNMLAAGEVRRIVLIRPAVEAGEKLGFLPGDIAQKIDPYVRPLYDALYDMLEAEKVQNYLETGVIELAPLAFMRGRTLNDAFAILDEGQNSSIEQMKMFLTRLGFGSRMVITGDITQIDLEKANQSGLVHARHVLKNVKGVSVVDFDHKDIVRHDLVSRIIKAYEGNNK
jgi:phosphate starvation-inducible PhoH-like protein